jgi:beta-N-acetylhexosaminidase
VTEHRTSAGGRNVRLALTAAGALMAIAAFVVLVGGGGGGGGDGREPAGEAGSRFREEGRGGSQARQPAPGTIPRTVAQLFVAGFPTEQGPQRAWGGLLVRETNYRSPSQLLALVRRHQRAARRAGRPAPLVVADPDELGELGPGDPPTLGVEGEPEDARGDARASARRVRQAGVDVVLAPSADLFVPGGPTDMRSFGDEPARVASFVQQAIAGWRDARTVPVPGRFPGEGAASQDPIEGPATVGLGLEELLARDIRPFAAAAPTAPAMQMSAALYAAWDSVTPATLLPEAVALLRRRAGFGGLVLSADLVAATTATGEPIGRAAVQALRAGCDMLLVPGGREEQEEAFTAVVEAVRQGRLPRARIDEALRRVEVLRRMAAARR